MNSVRSILRIALSALVGLILLATSTTSAAALTTPAVAAPAAALADGDVPQSVSDSVVRLYYAVFDRTPDEDGLNYWLELYTTGTSLETIAVQFINSPEWRTAYGDADDVLFVEVLYTNVLKRSADPEGQAYWIDVLDNGTRRSELLTFFSESQEFITLTGTTLPTAPSLFPATPADSGSGRRIIYDNGDNRVWLVEADETIVDSYLVSGRANTPAPGTYKVFSKSPLAWAGHDGITMKHMVRFTYGRTLAIGFHSIPRYRDGTPMQTVAELGTNQSAGCIRQQDHKAEALYNWADVGTTVVVLS